MDKSPDKCSRPAGKRRSGSAISALRTSPGPGHRDANLDPVHVRRTEAALRHAQKMEAIGLLAGGVAHDFRNQLTVIKGYSEMLLRRGMVTGTAKEFVEEILRAANRSTALTGELLAFGRKGILRPEVVNLNQLIQEIAKTINSMVGEDICLSIIPAVDLANIHIDPGQFQQAMINLAINARDAMPHGGQLTIETANSAACALVTVTDNGAGMDAATMKRIFEPFFTTKPTGYGTGLGLPMVYGFVSQSGGHMEVDSRLGQGATFRLYFPAWATRRSPRRRPLPLLTCHEAHAPSCSPKTTLPSGDSYPRPCRSAATPSMRPAMAMRPFNSCRRMASNWTCS